MSLKTMMTLNGTKQWKTPYSTGMTTGATRSVELLVEEFQSIFSFGAADLSSRGK
jgi:hypothetical protein